MISIATRYRPFSHLPGTFCLIPYSTLAVQAFPALLRFYDLNQGVKLFREEKIHALTEFTLIQDLERGCVTLSSKEERFHLLPSGEMLRRKKEPLVSATQERLYLGSDKKQEIEGVRARGDLREIIPLIHRLSLTLPSYAPSLLSPEMEALLQEGRLLEYYKAAIIGLGMPKEEDIDHLGITSGKQVIKGSPLALLSAFDQRVRALFYREEKEAIWLFDSPFISGRWTHLNLQKGLLSWEWTKGKMRRLYFLPHESGEIYLHFDSSIKSCRVRRERKERGSLFLCGRPIEIEAKKPLLLDRFQR